MRIGFTGTRYGMTPAQKERFLDVMQQRKAFGGVEEFHHGSCQGADAEAHEIVRGFLPDVKIVVHPSKKKEHEVPCVGDVMMPELGHLSRNQKIVKHTDELIATPLDAEEQPYGGTWFTIRFAREKGKTVTIIRPDGSVIQGAERV
jgi:hypothetical protein